MKKVLLSTLILCAISAGIHTPKAEASWVGVLHGHQSADCWWASVEKVRTGVLTFDLWHFKQKMVWCSNPGPHCCGHTVVVKSSTTITHSEGPTWNWGGVDGTRATKHTDRRYRFTRVNFDGITPTGFVEHNHPWIKMTVYANGHFTYDTDCGC